MYKQSPRSPLAKALKGNQHKLPQHLQDAIKAAPESPAKMGCGSPMKMDAMAMDIDRRKPKRKKKHKKHSGSKGNGVIGGGCRNTPKRGKKRY